MDKISQDIKKEKKNTTSHTKTATRRVATHKALRPIPIMALRQTTHPAKTPVDTAQHLRMRATTKALRPTKTKTMAFRQTSHLRTLSRNAG